MYNRKAHTYYVRIDDGLFPSDLFTKDEGTYRANRASDIVDSSHKPRESWRWITQHLGETLTGEDPSEQTLVISE